MNKDFSQSWNPYTPYSSSSVESLLFQLYDYIRPNDFMNEINYLKPVESLDIIHTIIILNFYSVKNLVITIRKMVAIVMISKLKYVGI